MGNDKTPQGPPKLLRFEKPGELTESIINLRKSEPLFIEYVRIRARVQRAAYLELIEQGFTPDEALDLCRVGLPGDSNHD